MNPRQVLADNLRALMDAQPELGTLRKITDASRGKLSNGKLGRIRSATHATDINTLGELAEVFGLNPWQLLVPSLNPKALPQLVGPELLESIRALVLSERSQAIPTDSTGTPLSGKRSVGRLPGEVVRTGQPKGMTGEVNQPGAVPRKRGRRGP